MLSSCNRFPYPTCFTWVTQNLVQVSKSAEGVVLFLVLILYPTGVWFATFTYIPFSTSTYASPSLRRKAGPDRVSSGLCRALYRVTCVVRMGSWCMSVSLVTCRTASASARKATWTCLKSKKANISASDGRVGDRSFFGLEGGALCQASEEQQNPLTSPSGVWRRFA